MSRSLKQCVHPGCAQTIDHPTVALCILHFKPHERAIEERRQGNPFEVPGKRDPREKLFNGVVWFWWRGRWRPGSSS